MSASDDVVRTSAAPSADISSMAMSATMMHLALGLFTSARMRDAPRRRRNSPGLALGPHSQRELR